ncbi:phasin family protein [Massilia sp. DWR3-1-1]|uniref:phasin family protein n=1 Tax=Massilia sp. DWR3-1-1 TaxID=2804559 RepID=UPI003CE9F078
MFPFSQAVTPAVRTHLDAQVSFMNDLSKSMFKSFQQMCDLNIQLAQTMLEETTTAAQHISTHTRPTEAISAASARAQPTAEKLRAYQQHLSRVAADAQVELARVTEQHVQETSRTAKALADEVQRVASEETERGMRNQQDAMRNFTDPFKEITQQRGDSARGQSDGADGNVGTASSTGKQPPTTPASAGTGRSGGAAAH